MAAFVGLFKRIICRVFILCVILMFAVQLSTQDDPEGFISIDCGGDKAFLDSQTNLSWVKDDDYVITGKNGVVKYPHLLNSSSGIDNYEALRTFRYFNEMPMRSRSCYELPMPSTNISYLLRVTFLHGNASELPLPIEFSVYVNATHWMDVKYAKDDNLFQPLVQESIFFSPHDSDVTYLYLVYKIGVPFISSLELRLFDQEGIMYKTLLQDHVKEEFFFTTLVRLNPGSNSTIRYPHDDYDRFWTERIYYGPGSAYNSFYVYSDNDFYDLMDQNYAISGKIESKIDKNVNSVPSQVMKNGWFYNNTDVYVQLPPFFVDFPTTQTTSFVYGIFYFALLNESKINESIPLKIDLDNAQYPQFDVTSRPSQKTFIHTLQENYTEISFHPPSLLILNALEFYQWNGFVTSTTDDNDVFMVNAINKVLNMTWSGDPCIPVPYNWIECPNGLYVESLKLSHLQNSRRLIELKSADFNLSLPWTPSSYWYNLSITNSNMDSDLFQSLFEDIFWAPGIVSMNMSFNEIDTFPDVRWWTNVSDNEAQLYYLSSLDFSYNKLSHIPKFADFQFGNSTVVLNVSNNFLMEEFLSNESFFNLSLLEVLNVSSNRMKGTIPWSLSIDNLPALHTLDISNNSWNGTFPANYYFENGSRSITLNADNNDFSGLLNLTAWHNNLKAGLESQNQGMNVTFNQTFSFLYNRIRKIEPVIEDFEPIIKNLIQITGFNESGILLGGNPYCEDAKGFTQKFLCRSSSTQNIDPDGKDKKFTAIILGSVLGGAFVVSCFTLLFSVIFRLWYRLQRNEPTDLRLSRMELLREMQEAGGAKICKMFSLEELRKATSDFGDDKVVGVGGYGKVYRGILEDGTEVAIKKAKRDIGGGHDDTRQFINEVTILSTINHQNLVKLLGCCLETDIPILVYEFILNGSLYDYLQRSKSLSDQPIDGAPTNSLDWKQRVKIAIGSATALSYLHSGTSPAIFHRDIKSANILLDKQYAAKVADFGLSKFVPEEETHLCTAVQGTLGYLDPEYLDTGQINDKSDVYSFGVLLFELLTAEKAMDFSRPKQHQNLVQRCRQLLKYGLFEQLIDPTLNTSSDPDVLDGIYTIAQVAMECCERLGEKRPTMKQVENRLRSLHESSSCLLSQQTSIAIERGSMHSEYTYLDLREEEMDDSECLSMTRQEFTNSQDPVHSSNLTSSSSMAFGRQQSREVELASLKKQKKYVRWS